MFELLQKVRKKINGGVVRLSPRRPIMGKVLLSYTTLPFISPQFLQSHTNQWECRRIAEIFLERGYAVDVVDFNNQSFLPKEKYDFCIDVFDKLNLFSSYLTEDCVKIFHATGAHWLHNNIAEYDRLFDIKKRRNIVLTPQRIFQPSHNIEIANFVTVLGNDFTANTYKYANKNIYSIPISTTHLYPSPKNKNFDSVRKNFIWMGGVGMVHKGLDLVLEAFSNMPDFNLVVLGKKDNDFEKAYYKELYQTKNIRYVGYVNPESDFFISTLDNSLSLIFPSCSEGGGGSVITAMHAGLIPIVTFESSVSVNDFGVILKENTIAEIQRELQHIASLPVDVLKLRAIQSWNYARKYHTRDTFSNAYEKFVDKLINIIKTKNEAIHKNIPTENSFT